MDSRGFWPAGQQSLLRSPVCRRPSWRTRIQPPSVGLLPQGWRGWLGSLAWLGLGFGLASASLGVWLDSNMFWLAILPYSAKLWVDILHLGWEIPALWLEFM